MNASTDRNEPRRNTGGNGTAGLERNGDEIRADIDRTLEAIERKLSPGELLDRSVGLLREHGSDFLREAGQTIRRNPGPVMVTAAGLIWLTAAVARSRSQGDGDGSHIDEDLDSFDDFADGHGYASRGASAEATIRDASSQFSHFVREQPLATGALALAVGALIGAALPVSDYENRMLGPAHDRAMARVKEAGREQYEKVRDAIAPDDGERSSDLSEGSPATS